MTIIGIPKLQYEGHFNILYIARHDSNLQKRTCGGKRHVNLVRTCESEKNMLQPNKKQIRIAFYCIFILNPATRPARSKSPLVPSLRSAATEKLT